MAKGDDVKAKKKNKAMRKKLNRDPAAAVSARVAAIIAAKKRRHTGKRRQCQGMCFSLPTPEDPFNDRRGKEDTSGKKNKKVLPLSYNKGSVKDGTDKELVSDQEILGDQSARKSKHMKLVNVKMGKGNRGKDAVPMDLEGLSSGDMGCPSKFLFNCLNSIWDFLVGDGEIEGQQKSLIANSWGFEFWKSYSLGKDILENSETSPSRTCEKRWITALSRFRKNVCILNCCGVSFESLLLKYKNRALGRFLCKTASTCDITPLLPGISNFTRTFGSMIGADEGVRELKMVGDPWLKTMIDLMQSPDVQEVEELKEIVNEEWFKTHLPIDALESVRSQWVHKILAKEFREHRIGSIVSDQFTDQHSKQVGAKQITNAAERYETIYPRHRANDTVTFLMAVKKRLRFSRPMTEKAKLFHATNYGQFLLKIFLDKIPLKRAHDANMMAKAKWGFEEKKTSKSAATIENHSGRSCRDWLIDVGMIFSKSQLCTKFDNRFRNAKAAQSIVCFQHSVLCRFAPFMRYIEMKLQEVLPKKFYIHSGKGLEELSDWVKIGRFEGLCTESDYEAFDASQDEYIVAFELALMKYLGLPNDLIEDYKYIKTHLGSKLGNFAIMRFSGEASTFLFNTMANMLFTFMRYNIKGDEFICFAGDDMCASKRLTISKEHESFLGKLKLKAKVQFTKKPTFCGWHLCPDGIYKKPQLVLERMCIAQELNNLSNCIDNYAIEVAFAYNMGERAVNRMDEEELSAFYNCVRLIVRNKHLLKSDVKAVFEKNSI